MAPAPTVVERGAVGELATFYILSSLIRAPPCGGRRGGPQQVPYVSAGLLRRCASARGAGHVAASRRIPLSFSALRSNRLPRYPPARLLVRRPARTSLRWSTNAHAVDQGGKRRRASPASKHSGKCKGFAAALSAAVLSAPAPSPSPAPSHSLGRCTRRVRVRLMLARRGRRCSCREERVAPVARSVHLHRWHGAWRERNIRSEAPGPPGRE